jgi:hypothetical protein
MPFKYLLAVSLFVASMAVLSDSLASSSIISSHDPVAAGTTITVKVTSSPCQPVTVILYIDGVEFRGTIEHVPGTCTLDVPPGTAGRGYVLEVRCPGEVSSEGGTVL